MVDLGCGNAYLTFAAQRFLTHVRGLPVRADRRRRAASSPPTTTPRWPPGSASRPTFVRGGIADAVLDPAPEVVLALHACDTATDDALARAVGWDAPLVLAAPCCHHDIAAQLRTHPTPRRTPCSPAHGILRERFADTLTDAVRASLLRLQGYRVDVIEFVDSEHTPRNTLLRARAHAGRTRSRRRRRSTTT